MEKEGTECMKSESLEEIIKTLKDLITRTEDRMKYITEGKTAEIWKPPAGG